MSVDEGTIRAQLALDIADFQAQVDAALAQTQRLGAGLQAIPDVMLRLNTADLQGQVDTALQQVQRIDALPPVKLQVDTAAAQQATAQYSETINNLKVLGSAIPPFKPVVDIDGVLQATTQVGKALKDIPDAKPRIPPPTEDAEKTKKLAQEVADALKHLTGGRVELNIGQLEQAGADAQKILSTLTAGFASTAATAAVASAAIVAAFVAVEHVLVEMGEHYEQVFRNVSAATGLTGHALEEFEASAINVGKQSPASIEAVGAAMQQLGVRLGITGPALEELTTTVLKFARVTGQDAGEAAKALSQILTQFQVPASQAGDALNILWRVSQQTQITMAQLEEQLKGRLAPTLQALGFDLTSSALLFGNMQRAGEAGRAAMLAFNKVLSDSAAAGRDPKVAWAELVEQLKNAGDVSTTTGAALELKLGRGFAFLSAQAKAGNLDVAGVAATIKGSGDTVDAAFERIRSGAEKVGAQLTILKNQFAPLGIAIAETVNRIEENLAGAIAAATKAIADFQAQAAKVPLPPQVPAAAGAVGALALGPAGIPIAAQIVAQAGQPSAPTDTHAEDTKAGEAAKAAAQAQTEAAKVAQIATANLAQEITRLQKQLEDTHGQQAQIEALLRQKQTLEETQKAIEALPPALAAVALANVSAAEAAVEQAKASAAQAAAAKSAADQDAVTKQVAVEAAAAQAQAADAEVAAVLRADEAKARQVQTQTLLTRAYGQYADVQGDATVDAAKYATAVAALTAAQQAYDAAVQAATQADADAATASVAQIDAANKLATAKNTLKAVEDATIVSGAAYAVQQERTNAIIGAAKPFLDAQSEAAIKVAETQGHLTEAITIAGRAMGLTDAQIQALVVSLGGSQQAFDQATNGIKALGVPLETLQARLGELATGAYPNLSKAQADALQATIKSGDATKEGAALAATYGVSVDELNAHLDDSKAHFDEWAKQVAAANRPLADFVSDEVKSRIGSALSALTSGTDAVTAAQAKQLAESGHQAEALELLASKYGVSKEQADAWAKAVEQGGGAAQLAAIQMKLATAVTGDLGRSIFEAQEKLQALVTFARDPQNGTIRLKVDIDIDAAQKAIVDLQKNFREASQQRADAETKATHEFSIQQQATAQQQSKLQSDYAASVTAISQARTDSQTKLGQDIQSTVRTQNDAANKIDQQIDDAIAKHAQAWADAGDKYQQAIKDATTQLGQGLEGIAQRTKDLVQQATDAAQQALRQVSGAMQSFNDQARITANQASIQAQAAQLASYGFTDFQSQQSALRAAQIQAEGTAGLAQVAGANQLNQTLVGANQSLQKATEKAADEMSKLSQQITKLYTAYQTANDKAGQALEKADRDADTARDKAIRDANEALQKNTRTAEDAIRKAQEDERQREKALDEKAAQEQQKEVERLQAIALERAQDPEGKGRTAAQQAFDDAEKKRQEAERKADEKQLEDLKKADATLAALLALKASADGLPDKTAQAIAARVKIGEQNFLAGATVNVAETEVDFLSEAIGELTRQNRGS